MNEVTITVSGAVGSGKSALCGEIEILCKALGLQVNWIDGQQEKNLTHADWTEALEMYKPSVKIVESAAGASDRADADTFTRPETVPAFTVQSTIKHDGALKPRKFNLEERADAEKDAVLTDDAAVDKFAQAMKEKMAAARAKGRAGWQLCAPPLLSLMLREHVEKGDPRDVANFCMMLWSNGADIAAIASSAANEALTDEEIDAIWMDTPGGWRAFARAILAAKEKKS